MNGFYKKIKFFAPFITFLAVILFYVKKIVVLKYYPPVCNFVFFLIFFLSCFSKETIIQKIAKVTDGTLTDKVRKYTRNLTYIWVIFIFLNFLISLTTVFMSDEIWMIYNGFLSYVLTGFLFMVEYVIRIALKKRNLL